MAKIHEGDIIRKLREGRNWSREHLAEKAKLRPNTIGDLEKYGAKNLQTMRAAANALGFEVEDIFYQLKEAEKPKPRLPEDLNDATIKLSALYISNPRGFQSVSRTMDDWLGEEVREKLATYDTPSNDLSWIPCYESIPAGDSREIYTPGQTWIIVNRNEVKKSQYALRVDGDSMEPDYRTGDIILMDQYQEPRDGSVVAALIDGTESTLKVYSRQKDEITLTPINKEGWQPRAYHADRVSIQGVLVDLIKRAK